MNFNKLLLATFLMLGSGQVMAESSPWYMGLDVAQFSYDNGTYSTNMDGGLLKAGYDLNNWLALEGGIGAAGTDSVLAPSFESKVRYANYLAGRFNLRFDHFTLYAIAGAAYTGITETSNGIRNDRNEANPMFGIGFDIYGSRDIALHVSAMQFASNTTFNVFVLSAGVKWYFDKPNFTRRY